MAAKRDNVRISKTMAFLLRHRPDVGGLEPDSSGFVQVEALSVALSDLLKFEVEVTTVHQIVEHQGERRFEILEGRIRALRHSGGRNSVRLPDICYHACTAEQVQMYRDRGVIEHPGGRSILLSNNESQAWRAAHRLDGEPALLYIDTTRARRSGVQFDRNRRNGLYVAPQIPVTHALNLLPNFAEQLSAGGIPITMDDKGQRKMALIQVSRRSGVTWEVAKGKLEDGEPPEIAAVREVQEEMGIDVPMEVTDTVGVIRYGFMAPGGLPRLKTVYLYLLRPLAELPTEFQPASAEGIGAVKWFTPARAVRAVRHSSLIPLIKRARKMVEAQDPSPSFAPLG